MIIDSKKLNKKTISVLTRKSLNDHTIFNRDHWNKWSKSFYTTVPVFFYSIFLPFFIAPLLWRITTFSAGFESLNHSVNWFVQSGCFVHQWNKWLQAICSKTLNSFLWLSSWDSQQEILLWLWNCFSWQSKNTQSKDQYCCEIYISQCLLIAFIQQFNKDHHIRSCFS